MSDWMTSHDQGRLVAKYSRDSRALQASRIGLPEHGPIINESEKRNVYYKEKDNDDRHDRHDRHEMA